MVQVAVLTVVVGTAVKAVSIVTFIVHVACYPGPKLNIFGSK